MGKTIRPTYAQDWIAYDKAKTKESALFKAMLWELLESYFKLESKKGKRISNKDRLFMMALKVYYNTDFRKCKGLIEEFTGKSVSYKSLCNFFEDESLSSYLDDLILITALPTVGLETFKDCKKANLKGVVLKSNQNIFMDKKKCIAFANKNKIFIKVI